MIEHRTGFPLQSNRVGAQSASDGLAKPAPKAFRVPNYPQFFSGEGIWGVLIMLALGVAILAPVLSPLLLRAQNSSSGAEEPTEVPKTFLVHCVGCHGADAHGSEHGPPLAGVRGLRDRSVSWIRQVILTGIPSGGMPAFNLPGAELDDLAAFVHSLNSPAAENAVAGDRAAGEQYFFGRGGCTSCHMVNGRGRPVGPDLSSVGNEMTVEAIRESLLQPGAHLRPGYELVSVRLREGNTVRGFARSWSNYEIVVQDLKGRFHLLLMNEVSSVNAEQQSLMPPVKASPAEFQDLIAYLCRLTGVQPGAVDAGAPSDSTGISWSRVLHPLPGEWLTYNGNLDGNRYSQLNQINTTNANKLALKWTFTVPLWTQYLPNTPYLRAKVQILALEATPLVADGIMYITGPHQAFALDAGTGQQIWRYWRPRPSQPSVGDAAIGSNHGMAILGDKVFMVTPDAHLIALNRTTGQLLWEQVMPQESMHYGSTVAPLVVKNLVIAGVSGADWGMRGLLAAYEASNGKLAWRRWIVPSKGQLGAETWGGNPRKDGGGSTWLTGSYDPETDTLFWTTATPFPDYDGRTRPGDNLYTDCILAVNPDNGKLKWYYQTTPHDLHAWDATEPLVSIDTPYRGRNRKLLLQANRNGFFYVFDRTNGHILLAKPFVRMTWASGIGADGRPQLVPNPGIVCPEWGTNWSATAFSRLTRLYYVTVFDKCVGVPSGTRYLQALNIDNGGTVWQDREIGPATGNNHPGVLATAGGLVFYGDRNGYVVAVDARTGKTLWHFAANGENKASPMTFTAGGKQFVALAVGPSILCFALP
jgi:PQQ-dependent dehydrogenase (methanol/ethanol family)